MSDALHLQLVRRSEGLQLVWHGQYLAALVAHEESHDTLVAAMAEQLSQLQGTCSQQLAALDTLHTQVHSMTGGQRPNASHMCVPATSHEE
jgi:predicted secreted Zn-dependent protease